MKAPGLFIADCSFKPTYEDLRPAVTGEEEQVLEFRFKPTYEDLRQANLPGYKF